MPDALTDVPEPKGPEPGEASPFFKFTFEGGGKYELETNMGDYWKWHVLKLASVIHKELGEG